MQGNHLVNAHRFLGWALALFLVAGPCFAATLTGRVVAVSDGGGAIIVTRGEIAKSVNAGVKGSHVAA